MKTVAELEQTQCVARPERKQRVTITFTEREFAALCGGASVRNETVAQFVKRELGFPLK